MAAPCMAAPWMNAPWMAAPWTATPWITVPQMAAPQMAAYWLRASQRLLVILQTLSKLKTNLTTKLPQEKLDT